MLVATVVFLSAICGFAQTSEFHPIAPAGVAPVVTAASSQYFERTFNRLVAAPALQPVIPIAPAPLQPAFPIVPAPPIVVDAKRTTTPVFPTNPPQPLPADPNIAIAIATAQAAAPVATILLPPYPFGIPPTLGIIPTAPPFNTPSENPNRESTTRKPTTVQVTTTEKNLEVAPLPSNNDNSFAQALPSNQNVNFRQYLSPPLPLQPLPSSRPVQQPPRPELQFPPYNNGPNTLPQPQLPPRPLKLKTTVEVIPAPLTYIAPPPTFTHAHLLSHAHKQAHAHVGHSKDVHFHTYIPKKTKIIIRPKRLRSVRVPTVLVPYKPLSRSSGPRYPQNALRVSGPKEREPTTFRPVNRPMTKPPRI